MAAPASAAAPATTPRYRTLTWLMYAFAIPVPVAIVLAFLPQLQRIGEVSHWPWEEYGVLGWWLIPLSLATATILAAARPGHSRRRTVRILGGIALLTTAALFFNP